LFFKLCDAMLPLQAFTFCERFIEKTIIACA
jgi:hypothetical protein